MFLDHEIRGDGLDRDALCLTFDDGPGPATPGIAEYLATEGISATFFVLGRNARGRGPELRRLRALGHLVGNHGHDHRHLPDLLAAGGDPALDVARGHAAIADALGEAPTLFRPPHGAWRGASEAGSAVARRLNECEALRGYLGPIGWDVDGADWRAWREGHPANRCAARYAEEIAGGRRGIVLLHDGSEDPSLGPANRTEELLRLLVPFLRRGGYRFVPLADLPAVRAAGDGRP
ncbi:Peptidoglycan-N-acetylglucosamine deacetylase [Aquisphaera giovannonii]|uniref:Peptidoglycan-N-acetylglucosamine deacetylase n=1 Tax=Aquisphaera giovannonii TaxID=406548 RepID=A0A5B9VXK9_9BACT|nr:polysaccharide deacetylase family protein [Aquisphaera giovannonii]QEH33012.1 Peptidoglycan-N-acetylglucosamine deacetylase [Aquisphaera giovannonii]